MQITDVTIKPRRQGNFYGYADITFDARIVIRGLRIIQGRNGLFVAMPNKKRGDGKYEDIVHPINKETRERIDQTVIKMYKENFETK